MTKAEIGAGDVTVILVNADGSETPHTLKPSLHAVRILSRAHGGLQPLADKLVKLDFDCVIQVLEAGFQLSASPKARAELEARVYATGLPTVASLCVRYITVLMHGGRLPPDSPQEEGATPNPPTA